MMLVMVIHYTSIFNISKRRKIGSQIIYDSENLPNHTIIRIHTQTAYEDLSNCWLCRLFI